MKKSAFLAILTILLASWGSPAQETNLLEDVPIIEKVDTMTSDAPAEEEPGSESAEVRAHPSSNEIVSYGKNVHLKRNETAGAIVVIGGSAKVEGNVDDAVVVIGGNVDLSGNAQSVVAVFGSINLAPGAKAQETVAVAGRVTVADGAETGEAVAIGGTVDVADGGKVRGEKVSLGLPGLAAPEWLQAWFRECLLKLRPLAPSVGWVWIVAALVFLFYLFIALVFRGAVQSCADEIINRPATTFLVGLLSKVLIPLLLIILLGTGIGIVVVPFVLVGAFVLGLLGKVGLLEAVGVGLGRAFGTTTIQKPILALLIGGVVLALLFIIPVVGLLVFILVGVWGLGAGVMAAISKMRRERPSTGPSRPAGPNWPATTLAASTSSASRPGDQAGTSESSAAFAVPPAGEQGQTAPEPGTGSAKTAGPGAIPPIVPIRYAGFWERMGAALLDIILVSVAAGLADGKYWWHLVALAYFSGMWAWRGTTIGGIVLGLKVARVDGQPLSFPVALIRTLTAAFSAVVLFLGFFWIGWDKDKQGWHDKVAGTVVVKSPKAAPLLMFS